MPLELEQDLADKIVQAVKGGEYPERAAVRMGATRAEFRTWWAAGETASAEAAAGHALTPLQELCRSLVERVDQAEAEDEYQVIRKMRALMGDPEKRGAWTGNMTYLERRYSDRWRKREMQKVTKESHDYDAEMRKLAGAEAGAEAARAREMLGG